MPKPFLNDPNHFLNDPKHWRQRAAVARNLAGKIDDQPSKEAMIRIASDYEIVAERAEQQGTPSPISE